MLRRLAIVISVALLVLVAPAASADEPLGRGFEGSFLLQGTHGYRIEGWIGSLGSESAGTLTLFVGRRGEEAIYGAEGEVTKQHVRFDLGSLGRVEVEVKPTGRQETVRSSCGGEPLTIEGAEYIGTIEFRGEEGFTVGRTTNAPLNFGPLLDIVCPGSGSTVLSAGSLPGARLKVKRSKGPTFELDQNHPGAPTFYEAQILERRGRIRIQRYVRGDLGSGALGYDSSLESAAFSAGSPFSGLATYRGTRPPHMAQPGKGTWLGTLKVDFPGRREVRLAGPDFSASIVHARRTESHG